MLVDFTFVSDGLYIKLESLSTGYANQSWAIESNGSRLGTGSGNVFEYTAESSGFYTIILTITKGSETKSMGVEAYLQASSRPELYYSILRQVDLIYPGILESYAESAERYKLEWQQILFKAVNDTGNIVTNGPTAAEEEALAEAIQAIVDAGGTVPETLASTMLSVDDTHNEVKWPYLWNSLIANLIARSIFLDIQSSLSGVTAAAAGGNGPIKKITTGPADTEWHNHSGTLDAIFSKGGLFDELSQRICQLGQVLDVGFPWCKSLPFIPIVLRSDTDVVNINKALKYGSSYVLSTFYR